MNQIVVVVTYQRSSIVPLQATHWLEDLEPNPLVFGFGSQMIQFRCSNATLSNSK
jgi:hypothetical protein